MKLSHTYLDIWDKKSIDKAVQKIIQAKHSKSLFVKWLDRNLVWIIILIAIIGSGFVAFGFIPLVIVSSGFVAYLILGMIGLVFGVIFESLIADLEYIEHKHHLVILSIIPLAAIFNFFLMSSGLESNNISLKFDFILGGSIYSFFLLLPYIVHEIVLQRRKFRKGKYRK